MILIDRNGQVIQMHSFVRNEAGKLYAVIADRHLGMCLYSLTEATIEKVTVYTSAGLEVIDPLRIPQEELVTIKSKMRLVLGASR
jgi:hypothetical protein